MKDFAAYLVENRVELFWEIGSLVLMGLLVLLFLAIFTAIPAAALIWGAGIGISHWGLAGWTFVIFTTTCGGFFAGICC